MLRYLALLIALIVGSWIAFIDTQQPESAPIESTAATEFSGERAFQDINFMAAVPHPVGSIANANVRDALVGRMLRIGLAPEVRPGVGVQYRPGADRVAAARVENIVGVLPGRDRSRPALVLMAHYDSVPGSPGAADDMLGVAVALETARALKARGTPARDVIVLLTDGEEEGLLGANHFFQRDPLAKRAGLVLNLEARGSGGRVNMFQTSPNNGGLIDVFQKTARRPASSSLAVMVYEQLPNDTDLTETLKAGVAGMNYAIIGSQFDYHSPTATPSNLSRGSLQDMGNQVLAMAGEVAFASELPRAAPSPIYSNVFGDTLIAYPVWFGWVLIAVIVVLLAFSVRWARLAGEFPASDILRGMGALAFAGLTTVAVLQFARLLTGAGFGYLEQRFLLAQVNRWEWAIMLISLGVLMMSAGDLARGRRWMAAIPVAAGLGCSAFNGFDMMGAVTGVLAGVIGFFVYSQRAGRKGAWAGVLLLTLILLIVCQIAAPAASYVLAWPLLVGAIGAAATSLSAKRGPLSILLLIVLAAIALGWEGGVSHFAFEAMDLMAVFSIQMITAGVVLWPLAQPDAGARKGLFIGSALLIGGFVLTLIIRAEDPWTPRFPQVTYAGYLVDQDAGRAWRVALPDDRSAFADHMLRADGGKPALMSHWAWRQPLRAAPAKPVTEAPPAIQLVRMPDGGLRLTAAAPPDTLRLLLQLRSGGPARIVGVGGIETALELEAGKWFRVGWASAATPLVLDIRPGGPGRLDVRYVATVERWPATAAPLPERSADIMPWDDSDSTHVTGTRAFTW